METENMDKQETKQEPKNCAPLGQVKRLVMPFKICFKYQCNKKVFRNGLSEAKEDTLTLSSLLLATALIYPLIVLKLVTYPFYHFVFAPMWNALTKDIEMIKKLEKINNTPA